MTDLGTLGGTRSEANGDQRRRRDRRVELDHGGHRTRMRSCSSPAARWSIWARWEGTTRGAEDLDESGTVVGLERHRALHRVVRGLRARVPADRGLLLRPGDGCPHRAERPSAVSPTPGRSASTRTGSSSVASRPRRSAARPARSGRTEPPGSSGRSAPTGSPRMTSRPSATSTTVGSPSGRAHTTPRWAPPDPDPVRLPRADRPHPRLRSATSAGASLPSRRELRPTGRRWVTFH